MQKGLKQTNNWNQTGNNNNISHHPTHRHEFITSRKHIDEARRMTITSILLQDHSHYKATGVLVRSWLMWTSPHHLTPPPLLFVCSTLSILDIKHTCLIIWCEMPVCEVLVRSWLMWTSPHHLTPPPLLFVCPTLSILDIKHTCLIIWCEMPGNSSDFN